MHGTQTDLTGFNYIKPARLAVRNRGLLNDVDKHVLVQSTSADAVSGETVARKRARRSNAVRACFSSLDATFVIMLSIPSGIRLRSIQFCCTVLPRYSDSLNKMGKRYAKSRVGVCSCDCIFTSHCR